MNRIIVVQRTHDFHACLKDRPDLWETSDTSDGAIGKIIVTHGHRFNLLVIQQCGYYSILIPWSDTPSVWHPTEKEGPFSTLTRGSFKSESEAHIWAAEHLGYKPVYEVKFTYA